MRKGQKMSDEMKLHISFSKKGQVSWNKGISPSIETRKKQSIAKLKSPVRYWLGKHQPSYSMPDTTKEKISKANKGHLCHQKTRDKIATANMGKTAWNKGLKGYMAGAKNPNWKGGITPEHEKVKSSIEFRLWREAVFARDNWTCQKYGTKGVYLNAHHIQNFADFPELRTSIENGITLSDRAHKEFHKKYGRKNNTREQLDLWLHL